MNQMAGQRNACPRCGGARTMMNTCYNQLCGMQRQQYQETDTNYQQRTAIERIEKELSQQGAMLREILELLKSGEGQ